MHLPIAPVLLACRPLLSALTERAMPIRRHPALRTFRPFGKGPPTFTLDTVQLPITLQKFCSLREKSGQETRLEPDELTLNDTPTVWGNKTPF